jgi:urease beta subunit
MPYRSSYVTCTNHNLTTVRAISNNGSERIPTLSSHVHFMLNATNASLFDHIAKLAPRLYLPTLTSMAI